MSFDLVKSIESFAPILAAMLGGPLAGTAVTALEGCLGLTAGAGVDGIATAIQSGAMTPETIASMRAADQKHEEVMSQQGIDLVKLNADHEAAMVQADISDRGNAREREVKTGDAWTPRLLALVVVVAWCLIQWKLMGGSIIPAEMRELAARVLGTLDAALMIVLYYYFGGSAGSTRKTELLAQAPAIQK